MQPWEQGYSTPEEDALVFPQIDETLLDAGVDPYHTPVDRLPLHAQIALATHYWDWESVEELY